MQGNSFIKNLTFRVITLLCIFTFLFSKTEKITLEKIDNTSYISLNALSHKLEFKTKFYLENNNVEVDIHKTKFLFTNGSSYCKVNNILYHLYTPTIYHKNDFLIPSNALVNILKSKNIVNNININTSNTALIITYDDFNITDYVVRQKTNGFIIDLSTEKTFDDQLIPLWKSDNNWISINVPNGIADIETMIGKVKPHPITDMKIEQMDKSVQISFLLSVISDQEEVVSNNKNISIRFYTSQRENAEKIKIEKKKYIIDKIVLDAGHGGKDPGACSSQCKIKEKDITLDITNKIGDILEKKYNLDVIYTRKDDRFVSLSKRSKIANESKGDIFISIHVNSIANSPRTKGYEVYFLDPDKSEDAINEVAKRENSVMEKYEKDSINKLTAAEKRTALLIHRNNYDQSYNLAKYVKNELSNKLNKKLNRGIKQQMFQVLWNVAMPNVLIEVGFITNKEESTNLLKSSYQQKIAEAICQAIINYKTYYEKKL